MKKIVCFICILLLVCTANAEAYAGYSVDTVSGDDAKEDLVRVLIVGNSFSWSESGGITYSIEQPLMELAAGEGHNLEVKTLAHGSARLSYYSEGTESHSSYHRELLTFLLDGTWDYVIFQEQTSRSIEHFESSTLPAVESLRDMVKVFQPQAKMLLYMNAGYSDGKLINVGGTDRLLTTGQMELYLAAAFSELQNRSGVEAIMVGMHSYRVNLLYPEINMVRKDGRHPTQAGYYLAACCFYYRIYGTIPKPLKAPLSDYAMAGWELESLAGLSADSLVLNKRELVLKEGRTARLQATVSNHLPQYNRVTYKSFSSGVASVDPFTGIVKANKGGSALILATTPDGLQAFCSVTVKIPLSFSRSYYLAGKGDKIHIIPQTNQENLRWSSSKKGVATVGASTGIVTVKDTGRAVITVVNEDDPSEKASYTLYVECDKPQNIKVNSTGSPAANAQYGNIKVSWKAVDKASGYQIYRSTSKNGKYELIGSSKTSSYTDKHAAVNKYYYYKVAAKNAYQYCTSPLSSSARGIIPKAAAFKVKRTKAGNAKLTWKANAKASGYIIYRSNKKNSGYRQIARITSKSTTSFVDKSVKVTRKKKINRYYRIKAYTSLNQKIFYGVKSQAKKL